MSTEGTTTGEEQTGVERKKEGCSGNVDVKESGVECFFFFFLNDPAPTEI